MNDKITVINNTYGPVGIYEPELHFRRRWDRKGTKQKIDKEMLEQLMNYIGVQNMFEQKILVIEDLDFKKEMGLEPEDVTEPVNTKILNDEEMRNLLLNGQTWEFKQKLEKLTHEEICNLVDFAIEQKIYIAMDRNQILTESSGLNVLKTLELNMKDEEVLNTDRRKYNDDLSNRI